MSDKRRRMLSAPSAAHPPMHAPLKPSEQRTSLANRNALRYVSAVNSDLAIGLHIVGFLTSRQGEPLTSELLADTYGTNPVVIRRVLTKLQRAGLIATRRGIGGGSTLAREPSAINLRQVYEAVTDNAQLLRRHPGHDSGVAQILGSYINELCSEAEAALLERLESVTAEQLDAEVRPRIIALRCKRKR